MKLGKDTGSLVNHCYATMAPAVEPAVGTGATILCWTDRHAATIQKVTDKTITVTQDTATRTDKNGVSESQEYTYKTNPDGRPIVFRLTRRGWRNPAGEGLLIGTRREYYDYSF